MIIDPVEKWIMYAEKRHMKENDIIHLLLSKGYSVDTIQEYFPDFNPNKKDGYFQKHLIIFIPAIIIAFGLSILFFGLEMGLLYAFIALIFLVSHEYMKFYKYLDFLKLSVLTTNAFVMATIASSILMAFLFALSLLLFRTLLIRHIIIIGALGFTLYGAIFTLLIKHFTNKYSFDRLRYGFLYFFKHFMVFMIVVVGMLFMGGYLIKQEIKGTIATYGDLLDNNAMLESSCSLYFDSCETVLHVPSGSITEKYVGCDFWTCIPKIYSISAMISNFDNYLFKVQRESEQGIFVVPKDDWKRFAEDAIVKSDLDIPSPLKDDLNSQMNSLLLKDVQIRNVENPILLMYDFENIMRDFSDDIRNEMERMLTIAQYSKLDRIAAASSYQVEDLETYDALMMKLDGDSESGAYEDLGMADLDMGSAFLNRKIELVDTQQYIKESLQTENIGKIEFIKHLRDTAPEDEAAQSSNARLILANYIANE